MTGDPVSNADNFPVGRQCPPFAMPIEAGAVRAFADAIGSREPAYAGDRAPVPPTFLTTAAFSWGYSLERPADSPLAEFPLNASEMLLAEEEFVFHGEPPRVGDVLIGHTVLEKVYEREGRRGGSLTFAVVHTRFDDASGRTVADIRTTAVSLGVTPMGRV